MIPFDGKSQTPTPQRGGGRATTTYHEAAEGVGTNQSDAGGKRKDTQPPPGLWRLTGPKSYMHYCPSIHP